MALPFRSPLSEEVFGSNEEDLDFLEFNVTTWVPRIWNGGILGILLEIRGACDYWHRGDAHTQIAFDILVSWMRVAVGSGAQQAVYGLGQDYTAGLPDADRD
ncbi:hypothetical protein TcBrA4_0044890 [Trypanosoma cruzi]|nr:hypothetical protein TcBrA4_0064470 [Trypanosoma cruzi]KAF8304493.1 hypothetical protein TcBrA4_0044890 [Trypanosoma cruzi]